ncbi:MAG: hypothetical protein ACRCS9_08820 [Hyphomicrobium sp.]
MKTGGVATAVALAGGVGDLGIDGGEQPELFEADAALPLAPAARGKSGPKGGRPVGARNRSTEEARQFFLGRYRSPLIGLGEIYSRSAEDLARALFLTRVVDELAPGQTALKTLSNAAGVTTGYLVWDLEKAFDKQVTAQAAALPYVERKQPVALDTGGKVAGLIMIGDFDGVSDAGDGVVTLDMKAQQPSEQYQQVSEAETVRHSDVQSDENANKRKSFGEFSE